MLTLIFLFQWNFLFQKKKLPAKNLRSLLVLLHRYHHKRYIVLFKPMLQYFDIKHLLTETVSIFTKRETDQIMTAQLLIVS